MASKLFKILFLSHSSQTYGAENGLLLFLKNLNKEIWQPVIVLPCEGPLVSKVSELNFPIYKIKLPWWVRGNLNIFALARNCFVEAWVLLKLIKIIRKEKIDLIFTNSIVIFSGALISRILRKPHIWYIREIITNNPDLHFFLPDHLLFNFIVTFSTNVIVASKAIATQFYDFDHQNKVKLVYHGFEFDEPSEVSSDINGLIKGSWVAVVVGTLQARKAQEDAIKAISIARQKIPNISLLLVGKGESKYVAYLKLLIAELDLRKKVFFLGHRSDVISILAKCDVFIMPSWEEPFGVVVLEAMSVGLPVIGVNTGGVKEIIENDKTGFLVDAKSPELIAEKMILLSQNPEKANILGIEGEKSVKEKYKAKTHVENLEKIFSASFAGVRETDQTRFGGL